MSAPLLELRELHAGYRGLAVVRDLSLSVEPGEIVALLGPNGAGKTTTLLTAAGILPPIGGSVWALGAAVRARQPHRLARRGVAFVPEDRSLFLGLSVGDNLRLAVRGGRADLGLATGYFPALEPLLDRRAGLLSGGEQQMLAIGRAILCGPRLLMIDELSLGLAPVIVEQVLPVLRRITDETGAGVLLVEQHVHLALEIADRAYVLSHGDLVLEGSATHLGANRHLVESGYLGSSALAEEGEDAGVRG
jgi:branched-chain amino acid transport system ATP-binding protein